MKTSIINSHQETAPFQELDGKVCIEINGGGVSPLGMLLRGNLGLIGAAYWLGYLVEKNNSR